MTEDERCTHAPHKRREDEQEDGLPAAKRRSFLDLRSEPGGSRDSRSKAAVICACPAISPPMFTKAWNRHVLSAIIQESFAVVHVGDEAAACFRECASNFQAYLPFQSREQGLKFQSFCEDGLCGWNCPSEAKQVFRCRSGVEVLYPSQDARTAASHAMAVLRDLAEHVASLVLAAVTAGDVVREANASAVQCGGGLRGSEPESVACARDAMASAFAAAESNAARRRAASPFDVFLYPNRPCATPNLAAHVDPGLLTAVPVTQHAFGLEVLCERTREWAAAEAGKAPFEHVILFCGDAMAEETEGVVAAARHRVARREGSPRMSLVFELRPPTAFVRQRQRVLTPDRVNRLKEESLAARS